MRNTKTSVYEDILAAELTYRGLWHEREYRFHPTRLWRADFHIILHKVLVEIDGVSYGGKGRHQTAIGFQADCEKINSAIELGYRVLRFTPKQVKGTAVRASKKKEPMDKAIDVIERVCRG